MTYAVELGPDGPPDWDRWRQDVTDVVRSLGPQDRLDVTVPSATRPHLVRPARLFGVVPAQHEDSAPWLSVRRDEGHAVVELVGSESFGGDYPFTPDEEAALTGLGWRDPGPPSVPQRVWNRWFPDDVAEAAYLPTSDARAAAALVTETARLLLSRTR